MSADCEESDIAPALKVWLDGPPEGMSEAEYTRLVVCLWESCGHCANHLKRDILDFCNSEAEELASEYLALVKLVKGYSPFPRPKNRTGVWKHMRQVLLEELNPAQKELWQLLSEALWELERCGLAKCLGGTRQGVRADQRNNTPYSEWCSTSVCDTHQGKPPATDFRIFLEKADKLPHFYPPGAKIWHSSAPRVIPPKDAEKLAAMVLDCADGRIVLRDLFGEFRKHVHLLDFISEPPSADGEQQQNPFLDQQHAKEKNRDDDFGERHPATDEAFWDLVTLLAQKAWAELLAENLTTIACQYILANALLNRKTKLEEFGSHSTAFDQKKKAISILRKVFSADEFLDAESEITKWHDKLWAEVLRCLAHSVKFCNLNPENPDSGPFIQE